MKLCDVNGNIVYSTGVEPNTVVVAAYNSRDKDKSIANLICNGTNDQIVLQAAIDAVSNISGNVILASGDYYLDGWSYNQNGYVSCLCVKSGVQRSVKISGMSFPLRKKNTHDLTATANLHLRSNAINQLNGNETRVSVIGFAGNQRDYPMYSLTVSNLAIELADNQHPIIAIDGKFFSSMIVENVLCAIKTSTYTSGDGADDYDYPVDGCIAIHGLEGSNQGAGYRLANCFVFGFGVGYDLKGEHLIAEQLGCRFCNYSYRFGYDETIGYNFHDLTLINCCHESCSRYPAFFTNNQYNQPINFYNYNIEHLDSGKFRTVSKAVEAHPGYNCGHVSFSVNKAMGNTSGDFFETGSGIKYDVVNEAMIGTN